MILFTTERKISVYKFSFFGKQLALTDIFKYLEVILDEIPVYQKAEKVQHIFGYVKGFSEQIEAKRDPSAMTLGIEYKAYTFLRSSVEPQR